MVALQYSKFISATMHVKIRFFKTTRGRKGCGTNRDYRPMRTRAMDTAGRL